MDLKVYGTGYLTSMTDQHHYANLVARQGIPVHFCAIRQDLYHPRCKAMTYACQLFTSDHHNAMTGNTPSNRAQLNAEVIYLESVAC